MKDKNHLITDDRHLLFLLFYHFISIYISVGSEMAKVSEVHLVVLIHGLWGTSPVLSLANR